MAVIKIKIIHARYSDPVGAADTPSLETKINDFLATLNPNDVVSVLITPASGTRADGVFIMHSGVVIYKT